MTVNLLELFLKLEKKMINSLERVYASSTCIQPQLISDDFTSKFLEGKCFRSLVESTLMSAHLWSSACNLVGPSSLAAFLLL